MGMGPYPDLQWYIVFIAYDLAGCAGSRMEVESGDETEFKKKDNGFCLAL